MSVSTVNLTMRAPSDEAINHLVDILKKGQIFHHQHAVGESDFAGGLRPYARYRDLGVNNATNGLVQAHIIRLVGACTDEVRKNHYHDTCFQMIYVLKGWETVQIEGQEPITMREGSVWIQPPKINHMVVDYSDGCEVLEIVLPAKFGTVEV